MRQSLRLLLALVVSFAFWASDSQAQVSSEFVGSRKERRVLLRTLECARELVQHSQDPFPGLYLGMEVLMEARASVYDVSALRQILKHCSLLKADLAAGSPTLDGVSREELRLRFGGALGSISEPIFEDAPIGVRKVIQSFRIEPSNYLGVSVRCKLVGPEVIAGFGLALSAGVEAGLCKSSDYRQWLAVGGSVGAGLGLGGAIGIHQEDDTFADATAYAEAEWAFGGFIGIGNLLVIDFDFQEDESVLGVGLGFFGLARVSGLTKVIPLGFRREELLRDFLN
jgi:hypothetical protein